MTIIEDRRATRRSLPDDATLAEFRARARQADDSNTYFHEDLAVLREIGYLAAAVPEELGGWGADLGTFAAMQRHWRDVRARHSTRNFDAQLLDRHGRRARALR